MAVVAKRKLPKFTIRGVERERERKLKAKIRSRTCSEPWVDAQVRFVEARDENDGGVVMVAELRKGVYPVKGSPGMCQCKGCERWYPPQYVGSSGHCDDCRIGAMSKGQLSRLQGSTSTINMARVKAAIRRGSSTVRGGV